MVLSEWFESDLVTIVSEITRDVISPLAAEIDRERRFPSEAFDALGKAGLLGLFVPKELGGLGGSLSDLVALTGLIGQSCGSTAICFLMHSCATRLISVMANSAHQERYLRPIARGEKIGALAFGERGAGIHLMPEIKARVEGDHFVLRGKKSFVTNGDKADFLIVLTNASSPDIGFDMIVVDSDSSGVQLEGTWEGLGLRGNNSIDVRLEDVKTPITNLLGQEGDGEDLVIKVVVPTFLLGVASVNVGIARGAYLAAVEHAKRRRYSDGRSLAEVPAIQFYLAEMHGCVESASLLVHHAAALADQGMEDAFLFMMQSKILASESAIRVSNLAMQVCGGQGYTPALPIERYLRDARAGSLMSPTTELLKEWVGKTVAGLAPF